MALSTKHPTLRKEQTSKQIHHEATGRHLELLFNTLTSNISTFTHHSIVLNLKFKTITFSSPQRYCFTDIIRTGRKKNNQLMKHILLINVATSLLVLLGRWQFKALLLLNLSISMQMMVANCKSSIRFHVVN